MDCGTNFILEFLKGCLHSGENVQGVLVGAHFSKVTVFNSGQYLSTSTRFGGRPL